MEISADQMKRIEKFYSDLEHGFAGCGKKYTRPADYIERYMSKTTRNTVQNQSEGKTRGHYHDENA